MTMLEQVSRQRPFDATIAPSRRPRAGGFTRGLNRPLRIAGLPEVPVRAPEWPASMPRPFVAVAGVGPASVRADALEGGWSLRFGMFGCADSETRGGLARVERGRLFGGDASFVFEGSWSMRGSEVIASLHIVRHGADPVLTNLFGTAEKEYRAECTAEVITRDLIEGRIKRPGFPDARLTMRRLPFRPR